MGGSEHPRDLTDSRWAVLNLLIPEPPRRKDSRGLPWKSRRSVSMPFLGSCILMPLGPTCPIVTCHIKRVIEGSAMGTVGHPKGRLEALSRGFARTGQLDVREAFIDGGFASAKKGAFGSQKTKRGKGTKIMAVADRGLPVAVYILRMLCDDAFAALEGTGAVSRSRRSSL